MIYSNTSGLKAIFDFQVNGIKIFGGFNFAGVFFLLEIIFTSAKSAKIKPRKIKGLHGMFAKTSNLTLD